jgi:lipopolysaccharide export system permease protein
MKLLDRHIFRELLGPFLFGVAAFTSIMFAGGELFKITELVAENHASLFTAVRLVGLKLPFLVVMTLPMAMLLSALLGFGRLSGDSESIALFASGVSLYRIVIPVILMAVVVTCGSFVLSEIVAPKANTEYDMIVQKARGELTSNQKPVVGQDVVDRETRSIYYIRGGYDVAKNVARDVIVVQYDKNMPYCMFYGKEAVWEGGNHPNKWSFKNGYMNSLGPGKSFAMPFNTYDVILNKKPDDIKFDAMKTDEMSFDQLRRYIVILRAGGQDVQELRVRLYQKLSLPIASLVFALIGAPLGLRPQRSSNAMGLGLSIVIIFGYWVLTHYMSILGEQGTLSPAAASFIPNLAGIGVGIFLIFRAAK